MATACSLPDRDLQWAANYALLRALLSPLALIPAALPLDPLPLLAGRIRNPLWLLPGMILGDLLSGLPWSGGVARALGVAMLGRVAAGRAGPWVFWMPLWTALGPEWRGEFPLYYVYVAGLLQGGLWAVLAPRGWRARDFVHLALPAFLALLHLVCGGPPLWPLPSFGSAGPLALRIAGTSPALLFLLWVWPLRSRGESKSRRRRRWLDLVR